MQLLRISLAGPRNWTALFIGLLLYALMTGAAQAQTTNTWSTTATTTDWHTATNWSQNRVPLATDDVVIAAGPPINPF